MRTVPIALVGLALAACTEIAPATNNGDFGLLSFEALYEQTAVGATNQVGVARSVDGTKVCVSGIGKGGNGCTGSPGTVPIVIDAATCGDGCTATIAGQPTGDLLAAVDVTSDHEGSIALEVTGHASDGSGTWTDRFSLVMVRANAMAILSSTGLKLGTLDATLVGARTALYPCPVADPAARYADCLGGAFPYDVTGDAIAEVTPALDLPYDNQRPTASYVGVYAASAGKGAIEVNALGFTRTVPFTAVSTSSAWTNIEFLQMDGAGHEDVESGTDTTLLDFITLDRNADPPLVAARARLADGTQVLLSGSQIACTPADRITISPVMYTADWNTDRVGEYLGALVRPDLNTVSVGDATCAVAGYEALGTLTVHVQ